MRFLPLLVLTVSAHNYGNCELPPSNGRLSTTLLRTRTKCVCPKGSIRLKDGDWSDSYVKSKRGVTTQCYKGAVFVCPRNWIKVLNWSGRKVSYCVRCPMGQGPVRNRVTNDETVGEQYTCRPCNGVGEFGIEDERDGFKSRVCHTHELECPAGTFIDRSDQEYDIYEPERKGSKKSKKTKPKEPIFKKGEYRMECVQCSPGLFSKANWHSCLSCPLGSQANPGSKDCSLCLPGSRGYEGKDGNVCMACPGKLVSTEAGATECQACRSGFPNFSKTACVKECTLDTLAGSRTFTEASECQLCDGGQYNSKTGCRSCGSGTSHYGIAQVNGVVHPHRCQCLQGFRDPSSNIPGLSAPWTSECLQKL